MIADLNFISYDVNSYMKDRNTKLKINLII